MRLKFTAKITRLYGRPVREHFTVQPASRHRGVPVTLNRIWFVDFLERVPAVVATMCVSHGFRPFVLGTFVHTP